MRDGRTAEPATAASLPGESASLAAAAEAALPPGATAEVAASPVVPLAEPQPAPGAAEGVQPPVAAQADLHLEVGAQAATLTAPEPQAAHWDEQGTGIAQVSCFIQTSARDIRASCDHLRRGQGAASVVQHAGSLP